MKKLVYPWPIKFRLGDRLLKNKNNARIKKKKHLKTNKFLKKMYANERLLIKICWSSHLLIFIR